MLKVIHLKDLHGIGYPVDPTSEFEPGMIAQIKLLGNDIFAGVSDGTAPFGIIDDIRTSSPKKVQYDEIVVISSPLTQVDGNGLLVSSTEYTGFLEFPNIVESSFVSTHDLDLNPVNGAITIPSGTQLNYDSDDDGIFDSFRVIVSYIYNVPSMPGDDSTIGSGMMTIYYQRGIYATDQYDPTQQYPLNATLYVGLDGKLTTRQVTDRHPGIAMVTGPPSSTNSTLEFLWL